jgi:hypothetical protein
MKVRVENTLVALAAHSHGIAGNRYFDGTLTFDDPAVADEAILPDYSYFAQPMQGNNAVENRIDWSFTRLLTPTLAVIFPDCCPLQVRHGSHGQDGVFRAAPDQDLSGVPFR